MANMFLSATGIYAGAPVTPPTPTRVETVAWATGTDAQIVAMVQAADAGDIDLTEYWSVGNERTVSLSAISASGTNDYGTWSVGESHVAQDITLVLMDTNHYTLKTSVLDTNKNTRTTCSFVVGQKNLFANGTTGEHGYMNSSSSNSGSWEGCARRAWCNYAYREAIPSTLRSIFKQFKVKTISAYNGSTIQVSEDYFALFAEKEVTGTNYYCSSTEASTLTQIDYYTTVSNRIKVVKGTTTKKTWFNRSPSTSDSYSFCVTNTSGSAGEVGAEGNWGIAPFGCI